jgi:hypothetical protein
MRIGVQCRPSWGLPHQVLLVSFGRGGAPQYGGKASQDTREMSLIGDTPKVAFDHFGKEWGHYYQDPLWAAIGIKTKSA